MVKNGKINKYGFIHVSREIFSELGLPRKQDIPVKIEVDIEKRAIICHIQASEPAYAKKNRN